MASRWNPVAGVVGVTNSDSFQWGLIPNNRWAPIEGAQYGQGILRTAPRLEFRAPELPRHCQWRSRDGIFEMDVRLREFDPAAIRSLDDIARQLHATTRVPPGHPVLEELDFIADRLLRFLDHLTTTRQPVGLIAPPNVVMVIREPLDYAAASRIGRRAADRGLTPADLAPDDQDLLRRAAQGRFVVLPDLGFSCPPMMSGTPSWLDENHEFRFIWDQPPQEEHVAIPEPWRVNRSAARMFAWVLTHRKLNTIPAVSPNERGLIGPCWDVLAKAVDGAYTTVEQFRQALQAAPLSTFGFGMETKLPSPAPTPSPQRRSRWGWLLALAVLLLLAGVVVYVMRPPAEPPAPLACCPEVQRAGGEAFYSMLQEYDKLPAQSTSAEVSILAEADSQAAAGAPAVSPDRAVDLVATLGARLEQAVKRLEIVEELLADETLLSADELSRAAQQSCIAKLRDASLTELQQAVLDCRELSREAGLGGWDLVDHVKLLDEAVCRALQMGGIDKAADPARGAFIALGGLALDIRIFDRTGHKWRIDALDPRQFQPPD